MKNLMNTAFKYVLARLEEPSTWTAGGMGFVAIHLLAPGTLGDGLVAAGASLGIILGALLPEKA